MSMRIRKRESGTAAVQRIVREEARKALKDLSPKRWPPAESAVHGARKSLKKTRAALRLGKEALGERRYRRENRAFRDAARPLSQVRDARVLIQAFDGLVRRAPPDQRPLLIPLRKALIANQRKVRAFVLGRKGMLKPSIRPIRSARKRIRSEFPGGGGWSALRPGLRRVYRAGRRALAAVRRDPSVENLHEWRKQTKYFWHHLEILHPIRPKAMGLLAKRAHQLSDYLGDDHDLSVLREQLDAARPRLHPASLGMFFRMIDRRRAMLEAKAMTLGKRVYRERPRVFVGRLGGWWRSWRAR